MTPRMAPAETIDDDVQAAIDAVMRGNPPLTLFTTLARDPRLFHKFFAASLLDRGHLTLRQREIVIDRTTALCGAEYEWGVHVSTFARAAGLGPEQIASLTAGSADEPCWDEPEAALIRMCDALHRDAALGADDWRALRRSHSEEAVLELLMLAGFYRTTSYLVNSLRLRNEPGMAAFSDYVDQGTVAKAETR
jgi:alkylhydroperoxidase family enzyme